MHKMVRAKKMTSFFKNFARPQAAKELQKESAAKTLDFKPSFLLMIQTRGTRYEAEYRFNSECQSIGAVQ